MDKERQEDNDIEYPIRGLHDRRKFWLFLIILPSLATVIVSSVCAAFSFQNFSFDYYLKISGLHWSVLLVFLILLWVPSWLAITTWPERLEIVLTYIRNILLMGMIWILFPYKLVEKFFRKMFAEPEFQWWYLGSIIIISFVFFLIARASIRRTALRDILAGKEPRERKYSEKWLWFNALTFFLVLAGVFVIEFWFMTTLGKGELSRYPHEIVFYERPLNESSLVASPVAVTGSDEVSVFFPPLIKTYSAQAQDSVVKTVSNSLSVESDSAESPESGGASNSKSFTCQDKHRLRVISWIACSILCTFIFFIWGCMANRLMKEILIPVTFHERDVKGVVLKAYRYLWQFINALTLKHPFLFMGGGIVAAVVLIIPLIFVSVDQHKYLKDLIIGTDQLIWTIGIFIAWFSPIVSALVHPDETFGEYFNQRLANLLMMVQGHKVIIGFGSLGKRVSDREIKQLQEKESWSRVKRRKAKKGKKNPQKDGRRNRFRKERHFLSVVTPDVRLEKLCTSVVIIDHSPGDVVYSSQNNLLGVYGAVAANIRSYKSKDLQNEIIHPEKRVLVPIVIGEAKEPFISSRVNLERAILIISTVPDVESVQSIFDRASRSGVNSIISVSRSDQISYLTYRARHHPIVLVYPKHNQGSTLGHRLWAAMLKVLSIYPELQQNNKWPRVLVVGNSKAYRFMIEMLWGYLPGTHEERIQLVQENFAFIVTAAGESPGYPELKEREPKEPFDMYWPETFLASGRFPYAMKQGDYINPLNLSTRLVNEADIKAIVECIHRHNPHILLINHDDFQKSSLMLLRCMRSLEKLKTMNNEGFHLPLLLLSATQGDLREQYALGDASRYYDALCRIHREPLATDYSYPYHSRFDHFTRELIGETISDSLADAEEIIAGARRSFSAREEKNAGKQFVEITGCLPNIPGALPEYLAKLAGLKFDPVTWNKIEEIWDKLPDEREEAFSLMKIDRPYIPSFQYLRHVKLGDIRRHGFALTGYAALIPLTREATIFDSALSEKSSVVRIFANDGRPYMDKKFDYDEIYGNIKSKIISAQLAKTEDPQSPGVPNVIDRLTRRGKKEYNTIEEYRQVMLDPTEDGTSGDFVCPGMNLCRIAAFQDYISASNTLRISKTASMQGMGNELLHARNYYCCPGMQQLSKVGEKPAHRSAYARVFCCAYGSNQPGMIATLMNALFFKRDHKPVPQTGQKERDWRINIDYFNYIPCQNSHFTLNRLFGVFEDKKDRSQLTEKQVFPLHLVRILPIGGVDSAKLWYNYAYALYRFLQTTAKEEEYKFYWFDANRKRQPEIRLPEFREGIKESYPILIVIKRKDQLKGKSPQEGKCKICGFQEESHDCKKYRAWV